MTNKDDYQVQYDARRRLWKVFMDGNVIEEIPDRSVVASRNAIRLSDRRFGKADLSRVEETLSGDENGGFRDTKPVPEWKSCR